MENPARRGVLRQGVGAVPSVPRLGVNRWFTSKAQLDDADDVLRVEAWEIGGEPGGDTGGTIE